MVEKRQDNAPAHSDSGYDAHSYEGDGDRSEGESSLSDQPPSVNSAENYSENQPAQDANEAVQIEEEK